MEGTPDVITNTEVENIEQSILEKLDIAEVSPDGGIIVSNEGENTKPAPAKKHTKIDLINDILKLEAESGKKVSDEKKLKRLTKQELEKYYAEALNQKVMPMITGAPENSNGISDGVAIRSLSNFNLLVVSLLEHTSVAYKEKTAGVALLENWSKQVRNMQTELDEIFKAIIEKYGTSITTYLDPCIQYAMVMTTSAGLVINENYAKKKQESKDD